jgi:hypothetical protein
MLLAVRICVTSTRFIADSSPLLIIQHVHVRNGGIPDGRCISTRLHKAILSRVGADAA